MPPCPLDTQLNRREMEENQMAVKFLQEPIQLICGPKIGRSGRLEACANGDCDVNCVQMPCVGTVMERYDNQIELMLSKPFIFIHR